MKNLERILLLFLIAGIFTSCDVEEVELVSVDKIILEKMQNNILYFDVTAVLDNPNSFNIKLLDSDLDLFLEGAKVSKAHFEDDIEIKKSSKDSYNFKVQTDVIDQSKLVPIFVKAALTGKVNVGVKGFVKGKVYFISKKVKIEMEDIVDITKGTLQ